MSCQVQSGSTWKFSLLPVASAFLLLLLLLSAGCTRPTGTPKTPAVQDTLHPAVTTPTAPEPAITNSRIIAAATQKPDAAEIIVTSAVRPDPGQPMEPAATVTDNTGPSGPG